MNDQIISRSDYDRALKEVDEEAKQRGATPDQIAQAHKDLLRNLIDQQLWISKGKELDITGETELVKQLDEIRKKYKLETMEDLEKAAREQGVSFEDFKANIRNQIITQQVMRDEVSRKVSVTPGEVQRYFEAHKQEYAQPESVHLSEILISTGTPAAGSTDAESRLNTAKAKADDIEAKLKAGADFDKLARSSSDGPTAAEGGDLGKYGRGSLNKVFEDKTFALKTGDVTEPIQTKQGFVIFKVVEHVPGGIPQFKDVEPQVEEAFYTSRMEPAMRAYLTQMREEAYIDVNTKLGYVDTGASPKQTKPIYSAYTPPAPKKKKKVQRTRFRETERSFRHKDSQTTTASAPTAGSPAGAATGTGNAASANAAMGTAAAGSSSADGTGTAGAGAADTTKAQSTASTADGQTPPSDATAAAKANNSKTVASNATPSTMKAGKKEKIRYGQAPRETLPTAAATKTEDAGALPKDVAANAGEPDNPLQPAAAPEKKTRYSERLKLPKAPKPKGPSLDAFAPAPADSTEVADTQTQSGPLGLSGDTTKKKKKKATATTGEKTRMQERPKAPADNTPLEVTPTGPIKGAPAPLTAPKKDSSDSDSNSNNPTTKSTPGTSAPQQTPTSPDPPLSTTPRF